MGIVEGEDVVLQMPIPMIGPGLPASADIDAMEFGLVVVGGATAYDASVDGTAVPTRCTSGGIEFPDGIRLLAGQILTLAAR